MRLRFPVVLIQHFNATGLRNPPGALALLTPVCKERLLEPFVPRSTQKPSRDPDPGALKKPSPQVSTPRRAFALADSDSAVGPLPPFPPALSRLRGAPAVGELALHVEALVGAQGIVAVLPLVQLLRRAVEPSGTCVARGCVWVWGVTQGGYV